MVGAGFSFLGRCGAGCHYEGLYQCHCVNGLIISPGIVSGRDEQQNVLCKVPSREGIYHIRLAIDLRHERVTALTRSRFRSIEIITGCDHGHVVYSIHLGKLTVQAL